MAAETTSTLPNPTTSTSYENVLFKKARGTLTLTLTLSSTVSATNTPSISFQPSEEDKGKVAPASLPLQMVVKHQVSPAKYPKALLKLLLKDGRSITFQLANREELERIRNDISTQLKTMGMGMGVAATNSSNGNGNDAPPPSTNTHTGSTTSKKRTHSELSSASSSSGLPMTMQMQMQRSSSFRKIMASTSASTTTNGATMTSVSMEDLDDTALAVTRSSLLATNPSLRAQHKYLVEDTKTVDEDDFWNTHDHLLQEEYAKICGMARAGTSSLLQSHLPLQGRVALGVEEMRQIFIMYPAVHKAYEEKVPLELSDEQFWRKYLESEYFHRDRGRLGTAARNHMDGASQEAKDTAKRNAQDQDARAAAVGTDDLFSRYDQKLREEAAGRRKQQKSNTAKGNNNNNKRKQWGTHLAVGQFDLASTFETERGQLLEGPKDNHPPNNNDDGRGAKVIQKYNRHWAMVLHDAVAGSNLMEIARQSVHDVLEDDDDAKASGGLHKEMKKLVGFAMAEKEDANHALGTGLDTDVEDDEEDENGQHTTNGKTQEQRMTLRNVEAYYAGQMQKNESSNKPLTDEDLKRHAVFSQSIASKMKALAKQVRQEQNDNNNKNKNGAAENTSTAAALTALQDCFPVPQLGRELLSALTKKMAQDSQTNAASLEMVKTLPEEFQKRLHSYFQRSSELLRHFFGLRRLEAEEAASGNGGSNSQKLARIVEGMETFYREMEGMRKSFPQTETGELQRKMCLPIMDQLDWAFKLHREGTGGGRGGGGFVTVEEL